VRQPIKSHFYDFAEKTFAVGSFEAILRKKTFAVGNLETFFFDK